MRTTGNGGPGPDAGHEAAEHGAAAPEPEFGGEPFEVNVLGPIELRRGPLHSEFSRTITKDLVAVLVAEEGRAVGRDELRETVLAGRPVRPEVRGPYFSTILSDLRANLRRLDLEDRLEIAPTGVRLRLGANELDARRFEHHVTRGRTLLRDGEPARARDSLRAARALWRGPAFQDAAGLEPLGAFARRCDDLHREALGLLGVCWLQLGRPDQAIELLRTRAERRELEVSGTLCLAVAHLRSGDHRAAISVVRAAATDDELCLDPGVSAALVAIDDDLAALDDAAVQRRIEQTIGWSLAIATVRVLLPDRLRGVDPDAVIGREEQLGALGSVPSPTERGRFVVLAGPSGIGKSSLLAAWLHGLPLGLCTAVVECSADRAAPLETMRTLLDAIVDDPGAVPIAGDTRAGDPSETGARDDDVRERAHERLERRVRVRELVANAGRRCSTLLVIDDVHRADEETRQCLEDLAVDTPDGVMVVVVANTSVPEGDRVAASASAVADAVVDVGPLSRADTELVVTRRMPSLSIARRREVAKTVHEETRGHPLSIQLLLDDVAAGKRAERLQGSMQPGESLIRERLSLLEDGAREALAVASMLGVTFRPTLVAEVLGLEPLHVLEALDGAVERELVFPTDVPDVYRFSHDVTREVARRSVPPSRAAALHSGIGAVLARRGRFGATRAALHLCAGVGVVDADEAARFTIATVDAAEANGDVDDAALLLGELLRIRPLLDVDIGRALDEADLRARRARCLDVSGRRVEAVDEARQAFELYAARGDVTGATAAAIAIVGHGRAGRESEAEFDLLDRCLVLADRAGDRVASVRTRAEMIYRRALIGVPALQQERDLAILDADGAVVVADDATMRILRADMARARLIAEHAEPVSEARLALASAYLQLVRGSDDADHATDATSIATSLLLRTGRVGEAKELIAATTWSKRPIDRWTSNVLAACCAELDEDLTRARAYAAEARSIGERFSVVDAEGTWFVQRLVTAWVTEDLEAFGAMAGLMGTQSAFGAAVGALSLAFDGRPSQAKRLLAAALDLLRQPRRDLVWVASVCAATEAAWRTRDADAAEYLVPIVEPYRNEHAVLGIAAATTLGPIGRYWAHLLALTDRPQEAVAALRQVASQLDAAPAGRWRHHLLRDLATLTG